MYYGPPINQSFGAHSTEMTHADRKRAALGDSDVQYHAI